MSKTSRIILWCVLIAVLVMCIALYIAAKRPIEDTAYRNAGKTYAESQQPGDETDAWHDFCYALTKAAVDAQNITLAAPYTWTLTRDNYNTAGTWPELTQSAGTPG